MNAHLLDEELIDHAFGLVEGDATARVEHHLAGCATCRARQADLRERLGQLSLLQQPVEAPEPLITDTLRRIRMAGPAAPERPWSRWLILAGSAAAAAVALIGFPLLSRLGSHSLDPAPAPAAPARAEGFVVSLTPGAPVLDEVAPLPETPAAAMPAIGAAEELAALRADATSPELHVAGSQPNAIPPALVEVTNDTRVALQRVDARAQARRDAAELGTVKTPAPPAVARTTPPGTGREVRQPAAAGVSPGPAVIVYAVAAQDFSGRIGTGQEVAVEQRDGRIGLSNRAPRALTVRVQAGDGTFRDVFLPPQGRTNLAVRARPD